MSARRPAAARSSSASPPQKPYSRFSRAQSRQSCRTGHAEHTDRAWPSRTTRASGRSPAGAKNNSVRPWHAASDVHASGPLKIKLEIVSTAAKADLRCGPSRKGDSGEPVGGYRPPESSFTILTAGLESVQQLGLMASIRAPDGRYQHKGDGWWS